MITYEKEEKKHLLVKLCFSLHFLPLDPHSECGSGPTDPNECGSTLLECTKDFSVQFSLDKIFFTLHVKHLPHS